MEQTDPQKSSQTHRQDRKRRRWLLLLPLLLLGCVYGVYRFVFVIQTVQAPDTAHYSAEEILSAAKIPEGGNLYSFSSLEVKKRVQRLCPYIAELTLTRIAPDTIVVNVTECEAKYRADLFGEMWLLSADLRVLERADDASVPTVRLKLPPVSEAIAGSRLVFFAGNCDYMTQVLREAEASALFGRLNYIDLRDKTDLVMVSDNLYRLEFGEAEDVGVKLRVADSVLKDSLFQTGNRAVLDLSKPGQTPVRIDNNLDLE